MSKKGENIFKRKDGRWEARYVKGCDLNNKIIYGFVYGKSYTDAKKKKNDKILELQSKNNTRINFKKITETFLKIKKLKVKESTYCRYFEIITIYLLPTFENYCFDEIDDTLLIDFFNDELYELTAKTQKDILMLLNQILKYGGTNTRAVYPKVENKPLIVLKEQEIITLENYILNNLNNITLSFIVALYSGLRIGEICALKWNNIDLEKKYIKIDKTLNRIKDLDDSTTNKTKIVITSPKSEKSTRYIPIPSFLIDLLSQIKPSINDDVYFLSNTTKYIEPRLLRYKFKNIIKDLELSYTFHMLRHTFATRCSELGFDPKTISELLGHSNIRTTLSLYIHPRDEHKIECMERLHLLSSQIPI